MRKRFPIVLAFLLGAVAVLSCSPSFAEEKVSFSLTTKIWSKYLDNNGAVLHDKPVLQNDLLISLPRGFYIDLFHSISLDATGASSIGGHEIDYTIGWTGTLEGFSVDAGISYLDNVHLFSTSTYDILKLYAEVTKNVSLSENHTLSPYLRTEFPAFTGNMGSSFGMWTTLGLKHEWKLASFLSLQQKTGFVYDTGALGLQSGLLWQYSPALVWKISESVSMEIPAAKIFVPLSVSDRNSELAVGIGISISF